MSFLVKLIGAGFLLCSTTLFGVALSRELKLRTQALNWFVGAIDEMAEKIRYSSAELPAILTSIYKYEQYYSITEPFSVRLKKTGINSGDRQVIEEFFGELGLGDTPSQIKRCSVYKRSLLRRLEDADRQSREKSRLYTQLGFFGGLGIVIVLI